MAKEKSTQTAPSQTARAEVPDRVRWPGVIIFVVLSYALIWLGTVPFWLSSRGLGLPGAKLIVIGLMFAPALGSLVVCRRIEHRPWLRVVGIRSPGPIRVIIGFIVLAFALVLVALVAGVSLSSLFGYGRLDLVRFSGVLAFEQRLGVPAARLPPPALLLALGFVQVVIASFTVNAVAALGEETGWRGYLLTALLPLGRPAAILISGVIWGLWHLPLILLGYEYPDAHRPIAVLAFLGFTVAVGALLSWLRLCSGSVLPCAVGHGTVNAFATLTPLLLAAGAPPHVLVGGSQGLITIACFAVLALILLFCRPRRAGLDDPELR